MTQPRHARESDNGRYYYIPGIEDPLVSVTNAISVGLSKYGLPIWYANSATEAAWEALPQMLLAFRRPECGITPRMVLADPELKPCDECVPCLTRHIKGAAERKRDSASFLGSRVHDLADAHVTGRQLAAQEGDEEAGLFVAQHLRFLEDFGIQLERDVVAAEATVAHPALGYAGTGDLWVRLPFDGFLWKDGKVTAKKVDDPKDWGTFLIDLKTSRTRAATQSYPENVFQLAALRNAAKMVLPDDTMVPNIRVHGTATLQLRAKSYALIPLPSGPREFELFQDVLHLVTWLHNVWPGEYEHRPLLPSGRFKPKRGSKESTS